MRITSEQSLTRTHKHEVRYGAIYVEVFYNKMCVHPDTFTCAGLEEVEAAVDRASVIASAAVVAAVAGEGSHQADWAIACTNHDGTWSA